MVFTTLAGWHIIYVIRYGISLDHVYHAGVPHGVRPARGALIPFGADLTAGAFGADDFTRTIADNFTLPAGSRAEACNAYGRPGFAGTCQVHRKGGVNNRGHTGALFTKTLTSGMAPESSPAVTVMMTWLLRVTTSSGLGAEISTIGGVVSEPVSHRSLMEEAIPLLAQQFCCPSQ